MTKNKQNRYVFSDADMLEINERIDTAENANELIVNSVKAIWNAILQQEGLSFDSAPTIDPTAYAVPADQMIEIGERIQRRAMTLKISNIGIVNIMFETITNCGPSTYNDAPKGEFVFGTPHILPPPTK